MDPHLLTLAPHTRGCLDRVQSTGVEKPVRALDNRADPFSGQFGHRGPRVLPFDEKGFRGIHGADAGKVALVKQGCADRRPGSADPLDGVHEIPVRAKDVGSEVTDDITLAVGGKQLEQTQAQAQTDPRVGADGPAQVGATQPPSCVLR